MGGHNAVWLERPQPGSTVECNLASMLALFDEANDLLRGGKSNSSWPEIVTDKRWLLIDVPLGGAGAVEVEPILELLTKETGGEAFYITWHSSADTFTYCHWREGKRLRTLEYNYADPNDFGHKSPVWTIAEGEPESWEQEVFFTKDRLKRELSAHPTSIKARKRVVSYWRLGTIQKGLSCPSRAARRVEWEIMLHYGLPTYYVYLSRQQTSPHGP